MSPLIAISGIYIVILYLFAQRKFYFITAAGVVGLLLIFLAVLDESYFSPSVEAGWGVTFGFIISFLLLVYGTLFEIISSIAAKVLSPDRAPSVRRILWILFFAILISAFVFLVIRNI